MYIETQKGVSLIETLISIAILGIVMLGIFQAFTVFFDVFFVSETQLAASTLANEQIEIIRNMPYGAVGTIGGVPTGILDAAIQKEKGGILFNATTTIRNIDDPFDGTLGGIPNDLSPADYKLVELTIQCVNCEDPEIFTFTGRVAPKGLETASNNGALFVQVIDASGLPVSGATVVITNDILVPPINIIDTTDTAGFLKIIDIPPAVESYHIEVSKVGYSSDQTYAITGGNPNPTKRDATVVIQTVTQVTFSIDQVSTVNTSSVTNSCNPVSNFDFDLTGAKLIGTSPDVVKFTASYTTDSGGLAAISDLEWDTYTATYTDTAFDVSGTIPTSPFALLPNASQSFRIVTVPKDPLALMVTVTDSSSGLPLSDASVTVTGPSTNETLVTGRGFLSQTDWSGGDGQNLFTNPIQYFAQDGSIEVIATPGEFELLGVGGGLYASSGWLESSTFNTGSASTFFDLTWNPTSQPPDTGLDSVRVQIATATTTSPVTWDFLGPDGTSGTYYTPSVSTINSVHDGDQYVRYKTYLQTASTSFTPTFSDLAFTFASQCVPPGQVLFTGLTSGTYTVDVTRAGYDAGNDTPLVVDPWQEVQIQMIPSL